MRGRHDAGEPDTSKAIDDEFDIRTSSRTTAGFQSARIFRADLVSWRDLFIESFRPADLASAESQHQPDIRIGNLSRVLRNGCELRAF